MQVCTFPYCCTRNYQSIWFSSVCDWYVASHASSCLVRTGWDGGFAATRMSSLFPSSGRAGTGDPAPRCQCCFCFDPDDGALSAETSPPQRSAQSWGRNPRSLLSWWMWTRPEPGGLAGAGQPRRPPQAWWPGDSGDCCHRLGQGALPTAVSWGSPCRRGTGLRGPSWRSGVGWVLRGGRWRTARLADPRGTG